MPFDLALPVVAAGFALVAAGLSLTGVVLPAASAQAVVAPSVALPSLLGVPIGTAGVTATATPR